MCALQHPRPSPAGIHLSGSSPASVWAYGAITGGRFENFKNKTLVFQSISHTFCPYCFVLCPACIITVLSACKLRKVHGVQKVSL
ncbi:unnamed protein product [Staurois parvus]|uniref:Uncharacterized protein n=1 Tax=Staurois parvus TaxID=386267 RepID=A0ABN9AL40_9NEOB|nr:unnamed protein product [Staurois parvus]